jgi:hypothetical protein
LKKRRLAGQGVIRAVIRNRSAICQRWLNEAARHEAARPLSHTSFPAAKLDLDADARDGNIGGRSTRLHDKQFHLRDQGETT